MQTIKWGPPGWNLLGSESAEYSDNPSIDDKNFQCSFFKHTTNNMLPCIHCRISSRQFNKELPIEDWTNNKNDMICHHYLFRNKVNDKLRKQGYLKTKNPSFKSIKEKLNKPKVYSNCGWDFLYAVVYNYPLTPNNVDKYNYNLFFNQLYRALPYKPARQSYQLNFDNNELINALKGRNDLTSWFYNLHCKIIDDLIKKNYINEKDRMPCFNDTCDKYEHFRAACNIKSSNSCRVPDVNHSTQHK